MADVNKPAVSERTALSRLQVAELRQICRDLNIVHKRKRKEILIEAVLAKRSSDEKKLPVLSDGETPEFDTMVYERDPDISKIPPVKMTDVYNHIVEESGRNNKCLDRGIKHFQDGDIQNLFYKEVSDISICFRCQCLASQKQRKYTVYSAINRVTGGCIGAKCGCPQGLSGNCSHICALLFALEFINRTKNQNPGDISCTSRLCKWSKPRTLKVLAKPLEEIHIYKPTYGKAPTKPKVKDFDPRHADDRVINFSRIKSQLNELMKLYPNTGLQQIWDVPLPASNVPKHNEEVTIESSCLDESAESLIITPCYYPRSLEATEADSFVANQRISKEVSSHIQSITREQTNSTLWTELHTGRITSSSFGEVCATINSNQNRSLISKLMRYKAVERLPWYVRWGKEHEPIARQAYINYKKSKGTPIIYKSTGLTLSPDFSFLGASSDGLVTDVSQPQGAQYGALEIKCPCSISGEDIRGQTFKEIALKYNNFFLKFDSDGELTLTSSSHYFSQVQGEMAIMSVPWVDFVVWNTVDMVVERIYFDRNFWENELLPKLCSFYKNKLVPEILTGQIKSEL